MKPLGAASRTATASTAPAAPAAAALTMKADDPGPAQVDAGELGGDLVVAHGPPAAPDPAAREVGQQHEGDDQGEPGDVGDVLAAGQVGAGEEVAGVEHPRRGRRAARPGGPARRRGVSLK